MLKKDKTKLGVIMKFLNDKTTDEQIEHAQNNFKGWLKNYKVSQRNDNKLDDVDAFKLI